MTSFKQLFIISAITRKSSARTWRPVRWSKQAEPLKPLIHSLPGCLSPRRYLNDTLCHRHIPSCHVARMTCATSPITLAHAFALALKITLAIEPIPYLLALVCALFALRLVFTISLVPRHQWHADVLTCTIRCRAHARPHSRAKIRTPSACTYTLLCSHSFSFCYMPPFVCAANDGWRHYTTCVDRSTYSRHKTDIVAVTWPRLKEAWIGCFDGA
jgi:hypothetical protein